MEEKAPTKKDPPAQHLLLRDLKMRPFPDSAASDSQSPPGFPSSDISNPPTSSDLDSYPQTPSSNLFKSPRSELDGGYCSQALDKSKDAHPRRDKKNCLHAHDQSKDSGCGSQALDSQGFSFPDSEFSSEESQNSSPPKKPKRCSSKSTTTTSVDTSAKNTTKSYHISDDCSHSKAIIGEMIKADFPILHLLQKQQPYSIKTLSNALGPLSSQVEPNQEYFLGLIHKGFYPKEIFKHLYNSHAVKVNTSFEKDIRRLKLGRHVFLASNQDRLHVVFENDQTWYYVPSLAIELSGSKEGQERLEEYSLDFEVSCMTMMPWLASLLFEFCTPSTIHIGISKSTGSVGKLNVCIELHDRNVSMKFHAPDLGSRQHATMLILSFIDVIAESPIMTKFLTRKKITQTDIHGYRFSLSKNDLEKKCDEIMMESEKDMEVRVQKNGKSTGQSQNLVNTPAIATPLGSQDQSNSSQSSHEALSNININVLPSTATTTDSQHDYKKNSSIENPTTSNSANLARPVYTQPSQPSSANIMSQCEQENAGITRAEHLIVKKFMDDPSLAFLAKKNYADAKRQIFGNAVLVKMDFIRKRGLLLTAYHVYEEVLDELSLVEVHFPNTPSSNHFTISQLKQHSPTDELDFALLHINASDITKPAPEPIVLDLPDETCWNSWRKLILVGCSIERNPEVMYLRCPYVGRIAKDISKMIEKDNFGKLNEFWGTVPAVHKQRLLVLAKKQMDLVSFPCNNENDRDEAIRIVKQVIENIRQDPQKPHNIHENVVQQLLQLLNPKRFVMQNGGACWGHSGSIVVCPSPGGAGGPVGMLLCGYPIPLGKDFKARHFCLLQGLKWSEANLDI